MQKILKGILLLVLLSCLLMSEAKSEEEGSTYFVNPVNTTLSPFHVYQNFTCHTLEHYAQSGTLNESNSIFVFLSGKHTLSSSLVVWKSSNLTLAAGENQTVYITCAQEFWSMTLHIIFNDVSNLCIHNLNFIDCSETQKSPVLSHTLHMHFEKGWNLELSSVNITNGGFSINNTLGQINIMNLHLISHFFEEINSPHTKHSIKQSFGNSNINYTSCSQPVQLGISNSSFIFHDIRCINTTYQHYHISRHALNMRFQCSDMQVMVERTLFDGFISRGDGGHLKLILEPYVHNYTHTYMYLVTFCECEFRYGHALEGGGAAIVFKSPSKPLVDTTDRVISAIKFLNVRFVHNSALGGGALTIYQIESVNSQIVAKISLVGCKFGHNHLKSEKSHGGIAIDIRMKSVSPYLKHITPSFETIITNCSFYDNFMHNDEHCSPGNGVVQATRSPFVHIKQSSFTHNKCSAMKAIASNLLLEGNVTIDSNNGSSGGGILLCDDSMIILKPRTLVTITNNHAVHAGGGICSETQCLQTRPNCFFQLSKEIGYNVSLLDTVKVKLIDNTANYAGKNLFGGSVDNCYLIHPPKENGSKLHTMFVFDKIFPRNKSSKLESSITSIARKICFCDRLGNKSVKNCSRQKLNVWKYPGESFNVKVVPVGQLNGSVPGTVRAKAFSKDIIGALELTQNVAKPICWNLTYTVQSNRNKENIKLYVQHEGDISGYIKNHLYKTMLVHVHLKDCPIGFTLHCKKKNTTICKCECKEFLKRQHVKCNIKYQSIKRPDSPILWIGYIEDPSNRNDSSKKYLTVKQCPFDYCHISMQYIHSSTHKLLNQDSQCRFNRTGNLCGACPGNLSVILGTSHCWECTDMSLLLIPVFALAGVVLIVLLTICDITISDGKLNGLIFFANIVHISGEVLNSSHKKEEMTSILRIIMSWINLDFGISACLYNGMDTYAKAWLQFAFPLYLWFLSGMIVLLSNRYIGVTRLFGTNSVRVLATVILLSFTKLLRAIITALSCEKLYLHNNGTTISSLIWISNANVLCLQGKHLPLFLFGITVGFIWLSFILFMLFIQCLPKLHCCMYIQRLKPLIDAYTGSNTSIARFWTGLLLLARTLIAITYSINGNSDTEYHYMLHTAIICVSLLVVMVCLPKGVYLKHTKNALEAFFLLLLLLMIVMAANRKPFHNVVPIILALIIFAAILVWHCWKRLLNSRYGIHIQGRIWRIKSCLAKTFSKEETQGDVDSYCTESEEDREPLLANSQLSHYT